MDAADLSSASSHIFDVRGALQLGLEARDLASQLLQRMPMPTDTAAMVANAPAAVAVRHTVRLRSQLPMPADSAAVEAACARTACCTALCFWPCTRLSIGPYRSTGLGLGLQFVQAGQAALPDKGGGADGGLLAGHGFKAATSATAQRAQGVAAGQAVQRLEVL